MKILQLFLILSSLFFIIIKGDCINSQYSDYIFNLNGHNINWPCQSTKNIYLQTKLYIPKNVVATRAQVQKNIAYIIMTRFRNGIPITLGQAKLKKGDCFPKISPYPTLDMQEEGNCTALQSAVDLYLDSSGILWVLDSGRVEILMKAIDHCPPKIIGINTLTGKVIHNINLNKLLVPKSKLQFVVAENSPSGEPFLYIADLLGAIIVYNVNEKKGYRVVLPDTITNGVNTEALFITLAYSQNRSVISNYQDNSLYFTYLSSTQLYAIQTNLLRNASSKGTIIDVGKKPNNLPMILLGSNKLDKLYLRYKGLNDIYQYDVTTCFKNENLKEIYIGGDCRFAIQAIAGAGNFIWTIESNFKDYTNDTTGCYGASVVLQPIYRESLK